MESTHYDLLAKEKGEEAKRKLAPESQLTNEFLERASQRIAAAQTERQEQPDSPKIPTQIPFWPEPLRAIPSELLRSALFSSARHGRFLDSEELASWGDTKMSFHGKQLTQFDESVWLHLVHLQRGKMAGAGFRVHTTSRAVLRTLGLKQGGANHKRLQNSITRLQGAVVILKRGSQTLKLASPVRRSGDNNDRLAVELDPDWLLLLKESTTYLDWDTRKALPTGLATWLHRYILSHRATPRHPHRIGLAKLRALSGMKSSPKRFKQHLKQAMKRIEDHHVVSSWCITPQDSLEFRRPLKRPVPG